MNWYNPLGIDLNPLIREFKNVSLSQQTIINLLQLNNQSQTLTNSLLKEQNQLLKKYLEPK